MNHVKVTPHSINFIDVDGYAVRHAAITCITDNGEEIVVSVSGRNMPIRLSYTKAKEVFDGWDDVKIVGVKAGRRK